MPNYKDLILKSGLPGKIGKEHLIKLILWKDSRELFLSQSHNDISELSKHSFLQMKDAEMGSTVFKFDQEESIEISTFTIEVKNYIFLIYNNFNTGFGLGFRQLIHG